MTFHIMTIHLENYPLLSGFKRLLMFTWLIKQISTIINKALALNTTAVLLLSLQW